MADETANRAKKPRHYAERVQGKPCILQGEVVSTKMAKTLVVRVGRTVMHTKYKKYVRKHHKVYAHDEKGEAKLGDEVRVAECRPYSKLKRYRLLNVVRLASKASGEVKEGVSA
jgi:small subunit ribosomal protein S17